MRFVLAALALIAAPAGAQEVSYSPPDLSGYMTVAAANSTISQLSSHDAQFLNDVTLTQTATIAISVGPRQLTVATNCQVGDRMFMSPVTTLPAGYMLGDIYCTTAGSAIATVYAPALAIGAGYSIAVHVTAFR